MIEKKDIILVADDINEILTENEIDTILEEYPSCQIDDPSSNWNLVIENMIYSIKN